MGGYIGVGLEKQETEKWSHSGSSANKLSWWSCSVFTTPGCKPSEAQIRRYKETVNNNTSKIHIHQAWLIGLLQKERLWYTAQGCVQAQSLTSQRHTSHAESTLAVNISLTQPGHYLHLSNTRSAGVYLGNGSRLKLETIRAQLFTCWQKKYRYPIHHETSAILALLQDLTKSFQLVQNISNNPTRPKQPTDISFLVSLARQTGCVTSTLGCTT